MGSQSILILRAVIISFHRRFKFLAISLFLSLIHSRSYIISLVKKLIKQLSEGIDNSFLHCQIYIFKTKNSGYKRQYIHHFPHLRFQIKIPDLKSEN